MIECEISRTNEEEGIAVLMKFLDIGFSVDIFVVDGETFCRIGNKDPFIVRNNHVLHIRVKDISLC